MQLKRIPLANNNMFKFTQIWKYDIFHKSMTIKIKMSILFDTFVLSSK